MSQSPKIRRRTAFSRSLLLLTLLLVSASRGVLAQAQDRILDSIEYSSFAGHAVVQINFNALIAYRKHFPLRQGITIDISIQRVEGAREVEAEAPSIATEVLLAPQAKNIPLVGVTYDATDPSNTVVVVRFTEAVSYDVKIAENQRALIVELPEIRFQAPIQDSGTLRDPSQLMTLEDLHVSNEEEAAALLDKGKAAMGEERFSDAITFFGDVLNLPDHSLGEEAERLLLEARDRAREAAQAQARLAAEALPEAGPPLIPPPAPALTPLPEPEPEPEPEPTTPPPSLAEPPPEAEPFKPRPRDEVASPFERQLDFGRMALSKGDFRSAMRIFSLVIAAAEDHPYKEEARRLLAETEQKINEAASQPTREPAAAPRPTTLPEASVEQQAAQWLDQAQAALNQNDAATAILLLEKIIETPGHALSFEAQRMLDQARTLAETEPQRPAPAARRPSRAERAAAAAQPAAAEVDFSAIEDPAQLMSLGREAMKRNDMQTASRIFSKVLNLPVHPFMPEAERLLRQATRQSMERSTDLRAPVVGDPSTLDDVVRMMEQGRLAISEKDYNRAIVIFTKLTTIPEHPHSKEALELLGVSRQRNNQLAHAKAIYQQFLEKYKEGEDAVRVKQRLAELISSQMRPKTPLAQGERKDPKLGAMRHDVFGSLSQYYYYGITAIETLNEDREDQSSLISYFTINSRSRNERYDLRSFFYGTHTLDFLADDDDEDKNRFEISTAYVDGKDSRIGLSGRLGRQSSNTPGVLGRFDGLMVGLDVSSKIHLNMAGGFPVDLNRKDTIATETSFLAFNAEFGDWIKNLDVIPFVAVQQSEGMLDRFAIGEEVRYFSPQGSFFNLLDYDASYGSLNIFLLNGQLNFGTNSSVHFNLDYRNSPVLTTRNALINQPTYLNLESLQADFDEEEIRAQAEERTGKSTIATLGVNYSVSEALQVSNDFTWTNQAYSDDQLAASPELAESEDSFQWNGRLTTNGLLWSREISILSLGYTAAQTYDNTAFSIQNRAPFGEGWSVDSRLRLDFRDDTKGEELTRIRPSAKLTYSWKRKLNFEIEIGVEFSKYGGVTNNQDSDRTFGSAGYRWIF